MQTTSARFRLSHNGYQRFYILVLRNLGANISIFIYFFFITDFILKKCIEYFKSLMPNPQCPILDSAFPGNPYKCLSECRLFLVKSCICSFILSCFWQPYECVTGLSKVFWVVVSCYVCYSVCISILFLVSFVVESLWVVLRSSSVIWRSLWVVVGHSRF